MNPLIGYALAFIIAAAASIGVYDMYSQTDSTQKVANLQNQHLALFTGLKRKFQTQAGGYGTAVISDANMILWGIVPPAMQANATTITNGWGGSTNVTGATSSVYIDEDLITKEACIALMAETPVGTGVIQIGADAAGTTPSTLRTVPVSPTQATTDCANATNMMRFQMQ